MHRVNMAKCYNGVCCLKQCISTSIPSQNRRQIVRRNYYQDLGVPPNATQAQIKLAYYKLSKMYHPDITKDDSAHTKKFREISEAYEVLGNYKLRKKYDRGMNPTEPVFSESMVSEHPDKEKYAEFSASRDAYVRARPVYTGKSPIYNFDEFYRMHYGDTLDKDIRGRKKYQDMKAKETATENETKATQLETRNLIIGAMVGLAVLTVIEICIGMKKAALDKPKAQKYLDSD